MSSAELNNSKSNQSVKSDANSVSKINGNSDDALYPPFGDPKPNAGAFASYGIGQNQTRRENKFGVIGEPCPTIKSGKDVPRLGSTESITDHSRLKPGDGDRLLDDEEPREVFGSRSYWKEPSYFGYGWLDGMSQLVAAQKELAYTGNLEKVFQTYPVFDQGMK